MRLADTDLDAARELAGRGEKFKQVRARNIVARRMRLERAQLFAILKSAEQNLRSFFSMEAFKLAEFVTKHATSTGRINRLNLRIRMFGIDMRAEVKKTIGRLIRDGAKLGFKNAGDALLPIFKANRESFAGEIEKMYADRLLFEASLSFNLKTSLARKDPRAKTTQGQWQRANSKVVRAIAKGNLAGQTFSERVVDLSVRAEADLRRRIANGIARGESPQEIARDVKRYVAPYNADVDADVGPGVYKDPFRNAMRIARTETNRAYAQASAEFAKGKSWLAGMMITLSPAHEDEDVCDDWAGKVVSPEDFEDLVPFHPHCMCYGTYVFKDEFLGAEEEE